MLGIFDSGFGGLTVLKPIHDSLPNLSTMYLGDNVRAPYGIHDHQTIYRFTLEGVRFLFDKGCPLVILACNSASAQALRHIQQEILPNEYPNRRVLGVIRPAAENISKMSRSGHVGVFGTQATICSNAYIYELLHQNPDLKISQVACPGITDLIENGKQNSIEMDALIEEYCRTLMNQDPHVDTVLLACTHYPIVADQFARELPNHVRIVSQGRIVADKLVDYLNRHSEIMDQIDKRGITTYFTTGKAEHVDNLASLFYGHPIEFEKIEI